MIRAYESLGNLRFSVVKQKKLATKSTSGEEELEEKPAGLLPCLCISYHIIYIVYIILTGWPGECTKHSPEKTSSSFTDSADSFICFQCNTNGCRWFPRDTDRNLSNFL